MNQTMLLQAFEHYKAGRLEQAVQLLRGELNADAALSAAQQGHRNYAKRQMTWFRREPDVTWLTGFGDDVEIRRQAVARVAEGRF